MTTYHGKDGVVKEGSTAIGEVKQFSVKETAKVADDTAMGDTWETHIAGKTINSWSGSITCNYSPGDTGQTALTIGASIALKLYPTGSGTGAEELSGTATITERGPDVNMGSTVQVTFSFQGNGTLTHGVAA